LADIVGSAQNPTGRGTTAQRGPKEITSAERTRHQYGSVEIDKRVTGPDVWLYNPGDGSTSGHFRPYPTYLRSRNHHQTGDNKQGNEVWKPRHNIESPVCRHYPVLAQYPAFPEAYNFVNAELFAGPLPHVLVTFERHAKARGYFSSDRFTARKAAARELAMNPDTFTGRIDEDILSTLAHEMAHVWRQRDGTPPRRAYHDRQWAAKMREIGL
jgi:hypothetical protein